METWERNREMHFQNHHWDLKSLKDEPESTRTMQPYRTKRRILEQGTPMFETNELSVSREEKGRTSETIRWDDDDSPHTNSPEQSAITTKAAIRMGDPHRVVFVLTSRSGCSRSQPHRHTPFNEKPLEGWGWGGVGGG